MPYFFVWMPLEKIAFLIFFMLFSSMVVELSYDSSKTSNFGVFWTPYTY